MASFNIAKRGGYEMSEVDSYVRSLEAQLKDYHDKAGAINKAIINAQVAADKMIKTATDEATNILKSANDEKTKILASAEISMSAIRKGTSSQLTQLKTDITKQKSLIDSFETDYGALYNKYIKSINIDEISSIKNKLTEVENKLDLMFKDNSSQANSKQPAKEVNIGYDKPPTPQAKANNSANASNSKTSPYTPYKAAASDSATPSTKPSDSIYGQKPVANNPYSSEASATDEYANSSSTNAASNVDLSSIPFENTNYNKPGIYRVPKSDND